MLPRKAIAVCLALGCLSTLLIVLGVLLISLSHALYDLIIASNMVLNPTSAAYDVWKKNPVPLDLHIYLFNWTNAAEVRNLSVKPHFEEIGPYVFDETKEKSNVTWNKNGTVSFKHTKIWWYNEERSKGRLNDMITSVNPTALSAVYSARTWSVFIKKSMNLVFSSMAGRIHSTHTAGEVLFDGYQDSFLDLAKKMPSMISDGPPMDKFGWFYSRNGSENYEGAFNMDTGEYGSLGQLYSWKYMDKTPYYQDGCAEVKGSAGEFFHPDITKDTIVTFFNADLCRYVEMEFDSEEMVHGIVGYKFVAGERFLDNGTKYPENKCFCDGNCMPSGALNASACRYGSPAFVSLPHFYGADPYYLNLLEGLDPKKDRHEFFMVFEPKTAVPLRVAAKLQLNLLLQPVHGFGFYQNVPEVYVPVLWFEQVLTLPSNMVLQLKILINLDTICLVVGLILIVVGIAIQLCSIGRLCKAKVFRRKGRSVKITTEEVPLKSTNKT